MDTFQDLNDYNTNNVARARLTLLSTLPTNNTPASRTAAATLDSRDVVLDDAISRAYGGDHDYLIETERNMGEVNDQFMRFTAAHNLNLAYAGNREGGVSSREGGVSSREGGVSSREGGVSSGEGGVSSREGGVSSREGGVSSGEGGVSSREGRAGVGAGTGQDSIGSPVSNRQSPNAVAEVESSPIRSPTDGGHVSHSDIISALADTCRSDTLEGISGEVTRESHAATYRPLSNSSRASSIAAEEVKEEHSSASSLNSSAGIVVDSDDYNSNFCRLLPLQPLGTLSNGN